MNPQREIFNKLRFESPIVRTKDPATSDAAAEIIKPNLGKIQTEVLNAFVKHGPMTARTAERLDEFSEYGFSTIRKRISELWRSGYLEEHGIDRTRRAPATIYAVNDAK